MRGLAGKRAVVTGGASGIGRGIVERLVDEGVHVISVDIVDHEPPSLGDVTTHRADVSSERDVVALFDQARARWGGIDVLCNGAGILRGGRPIIEASTEDFDLVLDVNVRGPFLCMKHGIPLMRPRGAGSVINIASISALVAQPGAVSYTASKGALLMMTRVAALEHAVDGIRVNAICPGTVDTPLVHDGLSPAEVARLEALHPLGRLGRPDEIAAVAAFLASDECPFATGAPFIVDGGRTCT